MIKILGKSTREEILMALFCVLSIACSLFVGCNTSSPQAPDNTDRGAIVQHVERSDDSIAPGSDDQDRGPLTAGSVPSLRTNQIRTRHLIDGSVTFGKLGIKAVAVTVNAASATVTTAADPDIAGGLLLGCYPSTNQDQFIDNIVLNANGSITMTLAANATANNVFTCRVMKPNAKGVS